jgi:hypothetical protein
MKNLRSAATLPLLIKIVRSAGKTKKGSKVALSAVKAMQALPQSVLVQRKKEINSALTNAFSNVRGVDLSVRGIAFEILIR